MNPVLYFVICVAIFTIRTSGYRLRRFVGGKEASLGQFPYLVSIRKISNDDHFCGGSIINDQFILTAAHCVEDENSDGIYIAAGTNLVNTWRERYLVDSFVQHEAYDEPRILNDIALIKLKRTIKFDKYIQKIPLSTSESEPPVGVSMTISGFGRKHYYFDNSRTLQYSNVTSVSLPHCIQEISAVVQQHDITDGHICTYDGPKGFCEGDSGGPLVYQDQQVGIVSWGIGNCAQGYPDVYVKVASYKDWIRNTLEKMGYKSTTDSPSWTTQIPESTTELVDSTTELINFITTTETVDVTIEPVASTTELDNSTTELDNFTTETVDTTTELINSTTETVLVNSTTVLDNSTTEVVDSTTTTFPEDSTPESNNGILLAIAILLLLLLLIAVLTAVHLLLT